MQQRLSVELKGGMKVNARVRDFTIRTDQPKNHEGDDSAPTPLEIFFASLGTCVGVTVASFCEKRSIPFKDIGIDMTVDRDDKTRAVKKICMNVKLPSDFPEEYRTAVMKAVDTCTVKKTIIAQPEIVTTITNGCST